MTSSTSTNSTKALHLLIVGAGVCGPIFALMMQRSNPDHNITVIERWPSLRTGGQQLDLKAQCINIMRNLGLLEELRKLCVQESGMEMVDRNGKPLMQFGVTKAGDKNGAFELTNEFEFMRGDFVQMVYSASIKERENLMTKGHKTGSLTYLFNTSITAISQSSSSATATFSSGETTTYDLIVAADGQYSRTRRLAFGDSISAQAFHSLNIHAAFYNIPRLPSEDSLARVYAGSQNRQIFTRTGNRPKTQVYLFQWQNTKNTPAIASAHKLPLEEQKSAWSNLFGTAGWQCDRFTRQLAHADDFYATEIAQIKMPSNQLFTGRVVLLGDAGYCPAPVTGEGTTLAIAGAYVLAGELFAANSDVDAALKRYEKGVRPLVDEAQTMGVWVNGGKGLFPQSELGIWAVNCMIWLVALFRVDNVLAWLASLVPESTEKAWKVPEYKGMNMEAF